LERVLVPLYLAHRYQVEAVSKVIGGVNYTYSVRGDDQATNTPVSEAIQQKALDVLLQTLQPDFLALPENIIRLIPPQPIGFDRDREVFQSNTGGFFDPLAAATSSIGLSLDMLLMPERLNRISEQQVRGALRVLSVHTLLQKVRSTIWNRPNNATNMAEEISRIEQQLYVNKLLTISMSDLTTPSVKGAILLEINTLEIDLNKRLTNNTSIEDSANCTYLLAQIKKFREKPEQFKPAPTVVMPPGQPIGCDDH
jgi:hypothetical protein